METHGSMMSANAVLTRRRERRLEQDAQGGWYTEIGLEAIPGWDKFWTQLQNACVYTL